MRLLLIHLSDIHITSQDDVITERYTQLVDAVKNIDYSLDICIVITTGDIAYSGTDEQYYVALEWFEQLKQGLTTALSDSSQKHVPVHFVMVPGNHDCDFNTAGKPRDVIADSILNNLSEPIDSDCVQTCVSVQDSFFEFVDAVESTPREASTPHFDSRLSYEYRFHVQDEYVKILCYNTAWLSRRHESQGRLLFPSDAVTTEKDNSALVIAAFHHPYNWLESNSARSFRNSVEAAADLILTGHEHFASLKVQQDQLHQNNICVEGGVLQDNYDEKNSEFNVFVFDTNEGRNKFAHLQWKDNAYCLSRNSIPGDDGGGLKWTAYRPNGHRILSPTALTEETRKNLDDLGIDVRHGERGLLKLHDIFLYPELTEVKARGQRFGQRMSGNRLVSQLDGTPHVLITGDTESGKTCLAKKLFVDLLENSIIPIFVDGSKSTPSGDRIYGYLEGLFEEQYGPEALEDYRQTDQSRRAIIIDDFDKLPTRASRRKEFLERAAKVGKYLIVLSHDIATDLEKLSHPRGLSGSALDFTHYRIQPLGFAARDRLVERWMSLGETADPTGRPFVRQLEQTTRTLDTLIGKNYVPSYPIYVLAVLQAQDDATPIDISASTNGYFYELFIRSALARGRSSSDFDVIASYLSFIAFRMRIDGVKRVSASRFNQIHKDYEEQYDIERSVQSLTSQLVRQGILLKRNDGYGFKYSYLFNYFVASYMRDHLSQTETLAELKRITFGLHVEDDSNILLFLAHLSKDPVIINELLAASGDIYADYEPATLEADIIFLSDLWAALPVTSYQEHDLTEQRRAALTQIDARNPVEMEDAGAFEPQQVVEVDRNDPVIQFVTALRHLEIMGQLLKNFPGSLEGAVKLEIAKTCHNLGLRSLSMVFEGIRKDQFMLLEEMSHEVTRRHPDLTQSEIRERARDGITGLVYMLSYGLISRIARAVGSRDLSKTYDRLLSQNRTAAYVLIDASLRLDNSDQFPEITIRQVAEEVEGSPLVISVLRQLVVHHFQLFPVDFRTKQSISQKLDIKYSSLHRTNPEGRMLPPGDRSLTE